MAEEQYSLHKPPLNLLVDLTALRHVRPWQINIKTLLELFRTVMSSRVVNYPRLHLHASAILSSSMIYRLKVENLYSTGRLSQRARRPSMLGDVPAVLTMPFRQEIKAGDIEELLLSLERLLSAEVRVTPSSEVMGRPTEPWEPDTFTLQIQHNLDELRVRLASLLVQRAEVMFSEITGDYSPIEIARSFILLLFLAQEGTVVLENVDDDIRVTGVGSSTP